MTELQLDALCKRNPQCDGNCYKCPLFAEYMRTKYFKRWEGLNIEESARKTANSTLATCTTKILVAELIFAQLKAAVLILTRTLLVSSQGCATRTAQRYTKVILCNRVILLRAEARWYGCLRERHLASAYIGRMTPTTIYLAIGLHLTTQSKWLETFTTIPN